jgi:hypothetical protein
MLRVGLSNWDNNWNLVLYNWYEDASTGDVFEPDTREFILQNATQSAEKGHLHGINIGGLVSNQIDDLEEIQIIAHSAGTWAARSAAYSISNNFPSAKIQIVLLDPFIPAEVQREMMQVISGVLAQLLIVPDNAIFEIISDAIGNNIGIPENDLRNIIIEMITSAFGISNNGIIQEILEILLAHTLGVPDTQLTIEKIVELEDIDNIALENYLFDNEIAFGTDCTFCWDSSVGSSIDISNQYPSTESDAVSHGYPINYYTLTVIAPVQEQPGWYTSLQYQDYLRKTNDTQPPDVTQLLITSPFRLRRLSGNQATPTRIKPSLNFGSLVVQIVLTGYTGALYREKIERPLTYWIMIRKTQQSATLPQPTKTRTQHNSPKPFINMEPTRGLEPRTCSLRVSCSTS